MPLKKSYDWIEIFQRWFNSKILVRFFSHFLFLIFCWWILPHCYYIFSFHDPRIWKFHRILLIWPTGKCTLNNFYNTCSTMNIKTFPKHKLTLSLALWYSDRRISRWWRMLWCWTWWCLIIVMYYNLKLCYIVTSLCLYLADQWPNFCILLNVLSSQDSTNI